MIRFSHTLLLSYVVAATTAQGMETPKIEITSPKVQFTPSAIQQIKRPSQSFTQSASSASSKEASPPKLEKKISSPLLNQSTQSGSIIEDSPRKNEYKTPSPLFIQPTESSKKSSPRKIENKYPSHSFTQSASPTSSPVEISPRKIERKRHSLALNFSTSSASSSVENSPRKNAVTHSPNSLTPSNSPRNNRPSTELLNEILLPLQTNTPETENLLLNAVKENNLFKVQMILNINKPDSKGNTPFIIAATNGYKDIINELLKQPTLKPNMQNLCKMTALHCAAKQGHVKVIKILIGDPRIDASIKENSDYTALNYLDLHHKCKKIKRKLFGRITLDNFVNKEVFERQKLINNNQMSAHLSDQDINISIKIIRKDLKDVSDNQKEKDRKLSSSAMTPRYADDEFIGQMIKWRLFYHSEIIKPSPDQALLLQQTITNNSPRSEITALEHF